MPTANEIDVTWELILKIGAIIAVLVAIIQGTKYLATLTPTAKLSTRVDGLEKTQRKHAEKIATLEMKTSDTEKKLNDVNEGIKMLGKSQISLLRHMVDGSGTEKMAEEADELTDFFIKR